jgi:protein-S-isoprenylcysteine O-methyltransferase Ste14
MIPRILTQSLIGTAVIGILLFAPAATLRWPAGWVFLAGMIAFGLGTALWLAKTDPDLLAERMRPMMQAGQPRSDKVFMVVFGVMAMSWFIAMGLEARGRVTAMPPALRIIGLALLTVSTLVIVSALRENTFAVAVVKLQPERGQRVIDSGPYAFVRHPMYSAVALFFIGVPLLLGSWWGLASAPLLIVLFAIRAVIEERTLEAGLPGYADYTARVRARLIPGVW